MKIFIIFISIFLQFRKCECARILIVHSTITRSHLIPLQKLATSLAEERHHQVTFVSTFPMNKNISNLKEIGIPYEDEDKKFLYELSENKKSGGIFETINKVAKIIAKLGNNTLQAEEMRNLMENENFDLLILGFYANDFILGLGDHFKCPTIIFSPLNLFANLHQITGNPYSLSATNHYLNQGEKFDFRGRLKNFLINAFDYIILKNVFEYHGRKVYSYNFPSNKYRSYDESLRNVSLLLLNSHFSTGALRPLLPNVVEVGGLHLKSKPSPLPENIKNFLDSAENGAILFSLGSKVDISHFSNQTLDVIFKVFSKLDQKIIMKFGTIHIPYKSKNIFISDWLPQDDILAHPNVKLFISHCGINGVVEAKSHGVPIIANPLYNDQPGNARKIENEGWGKVIDLKKLSEDKFMDVIKDVLENPRYAAAAKEQSKIHSDRLMDAKSIAIYWIEYVIRHQGAPHMHYPGADLNILQLNSLDVIGFLLLIAVISCKIFTMILKKVWSFGKFNIKLKMS